MRRREFIGVVGGAAAAWPLGTRAQQPTTGRPLIGILTPQSATLGARIYEPLRAGLRELGYVEGRNVWLEFHGADGMPARLPTLAAALVARKPDLIVAASSAGVMAARGATWTIPVVMTTLLDPVALGVVKSIARPEGNVTGIC